MIQPLLTVLPVAIPMLFALGAAGAGSRYRWHLAGSTNLAALLLSGTAAVAAGAAGLGADDAMPQDAPPAISLVVAVLIAFLAWIIVRYSGPYLSGEPGQSRYLAMLQLTLAAAATVVLTDHLLVLLAAWAGISLGLHRLLLFYPDRPRAVLAAHKKFLFARLAELLLLAAALLLYAEHGTWRISDIVAAYPAASLGAAEQAAALLLAGAALIKCAQLPVHGWLIQVVEAPTPVSALLHAGIVNLGGYLLILFGPLLLQATAAQWLVLVVAGITTVVGALVMATRISIKVKLAWSTSAQMGLMLVECALGLFELAALHLVAHSCYKACGFLGSGAAVEQHLQQRLAPGAAATPGAWIAALLITVPAALMLWLGVAAGGPLSPWLLLAAALTVVLAERSSRGFRRPLYAATVTAVAIGAAYALQKGGAGWLIPTGTASAGWAADAWVCLLVVVLLGTHMLMRLAPRGLPVHRLSVWLFAGLYLDEWVTRTTLKLWPVRLPAGPAAVRFRLLPQE